MGKAEKIGGIGKSPAIDKLNRIQESRHTLSKAELLKKAAFKEDTAEKQKINSIIHQYNIGFKSVKETGEKNDII